MRLFPSGASCRQAARTSAARGRRRSPAARRCRARPPRRSSRGSRARCTGRSSPVRRRRGIRCGARAVSAHPHAASQHPRAPHPIGVRLGGRAAPSVPEPSPANSRPLAGGHPPDGMELHVAHPGGAPLGADRLAQSDSPELPAGIELEGVKRIGDGIGPLLHRIYRGADRGERVGRRRVDREDPRRPRLHGAVGVRELPEARGRGLLAVGDDYVVRMPGPWDGPVRAVASGPAYFRLATLTATWRPARSSSVPVPTIAAWSSRSSRGLAVATASRTSCTPTSA